MYDTLKLDDRTYEEIRNETIANIVKHCPEWTNHNASDPGVAMVELFASMTEMLQYRFNRIPHKNYLAFLDMLGIHGNLVSPSVTRVQFNLVENFEQQEEKKSTKHLEAGIEFISKDIEVDDRPLIFETVSDCYISNCKLSKIVSKTFNEKTEKYEIKAEPLKKSFRPFELDNEDDMRTIYLEDEEFQLLKKQNELTLFFNLDIKHSDNKDSIWFDNISWKYFNGVYWEELKIKKVSTEEEFSVTFSGSQSKLKRTVIPEISPHPKYYIEGSIDTKFNQWLREVQIFQIQKKSSTVDFGVKPEKLFHNKAPLSLDNKIYPFSKAPKKDDVFIVSDEVFAEKGKEVTIKFKRKSKFEQTFAILWEYPILENDWVELQTVEDTTDHFKQDGTVKIKIPEKMSKTIINGEECYALRAKLVTENFTEERQKKQQEILQVSHSTEEGKAIPILNEEVDVPFFDDIRIQYSKTRENLLECHVFSNKNYLHKIEFHKTQKDSEKKNFLGENIQKDSSLYLGFDSYLEKTFLDLFFNIESMEELHGSNDYNFEIYMNRKWHNLKIRFDRTSKLSKSGDIRIEIPSLKQAETLFGHTGMWIRIKFHTDEIDKPFNFQHIIDSIILNSIIVKQQETIDGEYIGDSIGMPSMKFTLNHTNIIAPPKLLVGEDVYRPLEKNERFIDYNKEAYVYKYNPLNGEILFGDNIHGHMPLPQQKIHTKRYTLSNGEDGNVGQGQLTLNTSIPSIESATNIVPATGGANAETLEDLIQRAPEVLRIKNRVVTAKDYEDAAVDFSPYIVNAKAISRENNIVDVIVVTKDTLEQSSTKEALELQNLEKRLEKMSLVTVKPNVKPAETIRINIEVELISTREDKNISEELKRKLEKHARDYFDVTQNFPMGELVISEADLYKILHQVSFEFYYKDIKIWEEGTSESDKTNSFQLSDNSKVIQLNSFEIKD